MKKIPVWIDCDAGIDDFAAIALAHSLKEMEILGISSVYGKTYAENTYKNCLAFVKSLGAEYPIFRGAENPLINKACAFQSEGECCCAEFTPSEDVLRKEFAWDALYDCAKANPGELRLITLGPLTNIAAVFMKYPELSELLHSVTVKGGAAKFGDITPAAEYNIYADYHSADIVFRAGAKMNVLFLEATRGIALKKEELSNIVSKSSAFSALLAPVISCSGENISLGDTCPVMYLVHPELFITDEVGIVVETRGTITNGRTVTDAYSDRQFTFKNAIAALEADTESYLRTLKEALREP